jgi:hypothetical protein
MISWWPFMPSQKLILMKKGIFCMAIGFYLIVGVSCTREKIVQSLARQTKNTNSPDFLSKGYVYLGNKRRSKPIIKADGTIVSMDGKQLIINKNEILQKYSKNYSGIPFISSYIFFICARK